MTICKLIYGFAAPHDGNGLLDLSQKIKAAHSDWQVDVCQWNDTVSVPAGDVVLIGHSFGGHQAVKTAQRLWNYSREVKHLFLLDPVVQSWFPLFWMPAFVFKLPDNVKKADCWLKPFGLPPSSPIRNESENFVNHKTKLGHNEIPRDSGIHDFILAQL
jgi:pimeloyl-ACP methyl ester carboxylesterase